MADRLSSAPRKARSPGRGRLPSVEGLVDRDTSQLVGILKRFGIDPDLKAIERRANTAFERLDALLEAGQEPDAATWTAIQKQVEGDVERSLRTMTKAAIRNYQDARAQEISDKAIWQCVDAGEDSCPSCEPRHGQVKTFKAWDRLGRPGSAALICSRECRCRLIPV